MSNELIDALRSLLFGINGLINNDPLPSGHPGHEAYLRIVAIPRAEVALKASEAPAEKKDLDMSRTRYEIQHLDFADGGRSWHVYDTIERNHIHTATHGFLNEDKSCPESVTRICAALNTMEVAKHLTTCKAKS